MRAVFPDSNGIVWHGSADPEDFKLETPVPLITLLTDFGNRDPYVGMMKGVILGRLWSARIVDLTHEIAPQAVRQAALVLESSWRWFPPGTVHTAVVDPGVGTDRAVVLLESGGHFFLAPDNGLLGFLAASPWTGRRVERPDLYLQPVSQTFHGRDVFAPVAAYLAGGGDPAALGPPLTSFAGEPLPEPRPVAGGVEAEILAVDRYGNLITSLRPSRLAGRCRIHAGGVCIEELSPSYASAPAGALLAIAGSSGRIEISVNGGDAAQRLGLSVGDRIVVECGS